MSTLPLLPLTDVLAGKAFRPGPLKRLHRQTEIGYADGLSYSRPAREIKRRNVIDFSGEANVSESYAWGGDQCAQQRRVEILGCVILPLSDVLHTLRGRSSVG